MTLYNFFTTPIKDQELLKPIYKELLAVCENVEIVQAGDNFSIMGQIISMNTSGGSMALLDIMPDVQYFCLDSFNVHDHYFNIGRK